MKHLIPALALALATALVANAGQFVVFYTLPGGDKVHQKTVEAKDPVSAGEKVKAMVPGAKIGEIKEAPKQ